MHDAEGPRKLRGSTLRARLGAAKDRILFARTPSRFGTGWALVRERFAGTLAPCLVPQTEWRPVPGWNIGSGQMSRAGRHRRMLWDFLAQSAVPPSSRTRLYGEVLFTIAFRSEVDRAIFCSGAYEPNECCFVRAALRDGGLFVDVGANEGVFSLVAAAASQAVCVQAFEPSGRERAILTRNVVANGWQDRIRVRDEALGDEQGSATLRVARWPAAGLNTIGRGFAYDADEARTEVVPLTTLDEKLDGQRPQLIKIDVEGSELAVLRGARETLRRARPILLLEVNDAALRMSGSSSEDLFAFLDASGFTSFGFDEATGLVSQRALVDPPIDGCNIVAVEKSGQDRLEAIRHYCRQLAT